MEFRALRADEIVCRVQQVSENGVMLLLYKDARCDMNVLDDTVGCFGWQRKHEHINSKEFCTVAIKNPESGEWVEKQDCGTESNTEKQKGESSDAFKRACSSWGIGRELYTKIPIFIKSDVVKAGSRYSLVDKYAKFIVSKIETDNKSKKILHLEIQNKFNQVIFVWDNKNPPKRYEIKKEPLSLDKIAYALDLAAKKGFSKEQVHIKIRKEFGKADLILLNNIEYTKVISDLEKSKDKKGEENEQGYNFG